MVKIIICLLSASFAILYKQFDIMSYVLGAILGMLYMFIDITDKY